ncbi:hypothetical protein T5B8_05528 [Salinisphaera sp. T5B8]|uniref:hypothetical protein n=1 Tax=unclassified Salinisphaera TaxID=2649847 RepID=UPI000C5F0940|nr:hypothetical protein [Salinisphaera sp.]MBS64255.1 hypothetical protein [Salinisphaera sp.]
MDTGLERRNGRPLTASRVVDEVCRHPVITGAAVVGTAVVLGALLHYGPAPRRRRSLFDRVRASLRSLFD